MAGVDAERKALLLRPLDRLLAGAEGGHLAAKCCQTRPAGLKLANQRMIGRQRAEGRAEDGVVTGGVDGERLAQLAPVLVLEREREAHSLRLADPVPLHEAHFLRPLVEAVERLEELLG